VSQPDVRSEKANHTTQFPHRHGEACKWLAKRPFPREENGKLYGLGSNDAGASVVTLLQVFLQLCRTQQSYNLIYLASCEEEVSGKDGIESVLKGLPPISFAIVGEPTEMQPLPKRG
jgi:acetylornithine deacetylase